MIEAFTPSPTGPGSIVKSKWFLNLGPDMAVLLLFLTLYEGARCTRKKVRKQGRPENDSRTIIRRIDSCASLSKINFWSERKL